MLLQIKCWEIFYKHCTVNSFIYYFKKLDAEQMELLIGSAGARNPLWLSLSCEELRVFGVFETITRHIRSLPATLKELLQFIMNRLTNEDQENNIYKVFHFLSSRLCRLHFCHSLKSGLLAVFFPEQRPVIELTASIVIFNVLLKIKVVCSRVVFRIFLVQSECEIFHVSLTCSQNFMLLSNVPA